MFQVTYRDKIKKLDSKKSLKTSVNLMKFLLQYLKKDEVELSETVKASFFPEAVEKFIVEVFFQHQKCQNL